MVVGNARGSSLGGVVAVSISSKYDISGLGARSVCGLGVRASVTVVGS